MDRQRTIRPLSATQLAAGLEAAAKVERRLHPYLLTLARAGLRPSEGLALSGTTSPSCDLRHTFATELLAQGAPITYVAAQLGHTEPTVTIQQYAHWLPCGDKHWVDALDRAGSVALGSRFNRG